MDNGEWNSSAPDEQGFYEIAWEVISRLSVVRLLEDCVEALVEAYQIDEELYLTDKEMIDEEDAQAISIPMHTYINTVIEKNQDEEQEEQDVIVTE